MRVVIKGRNKFCGFLVDDLFYHHLILRGAIRGSNIASIDFSDPPITLDEIQQSSILDCEFKLF